MVNKDVTITRLQEKIKAVFFEIKENVNTNQDIIDSLEWLIEEINQEIIKLLNL